MRKDIPSIYINNASQKTEYKKTINLELDKLKNGEIKGTKIDLTKIKINTLSKKIGLLSEDVKMYMYLSNSKRFYALNDRTINLLTRGDIDMSATTSQTAEVITDSDKEVVDSINVEQEVELFTVEKIRQEQVDHPFHILILLYLVFLNMTFLHLLTERIKHNCLYLALEPGGLSDIKLQDLKLSLRNRHVHKCD